MNKNCQTEQKESTDTWNILTAARGKGRNRMIDGEEYYA